MGRANPSHEDAAAIKQTLTTGDNTMAVDPMLNSKIEAIEQHLEERDEQERKQAAEWIARQSYQVGFNEASAQMRDAQLTNGVKHVMTTAVNEALDSLWNVSVSDEDKQELVDKTLSAVNPQMATSLKEMLLKHRPEDIKHVAKQVLSQQISTSENLAPKFKAATEQVNRIVELELSNNINDAWEGACQEFAAGWNATHSKASKSSSEEPNWRGFFPPQYSGK